MQNQLVFRYQDHSEFRTFDINGDLWFALVDVCRALDIKNPSDVAARLDPDEKMTLDLTEGHSGTRGGARAMTAINESGLYTAILRSDKAEAKRFKKWVTSEVLPSIRRTGSYSRFGGAPAFIRRYNQNWDRISPGHFSVISELTIRLWGRLEQVGYVMADRAADGAELRPDVSVGRLFSGWLKENHPDVADDYGRYSHITPEAEVDAREYPNTMWPLFTEFVDMVWIPEHAERYFRSRDPGALPHLPRLLPPARQPRLAPAAVPSLTRPRRAWSH
jgi:prophage antirepressor-like protein